LSQILHYEKEYCLLPILIAKFIPLSLTRLFPVIITFSFFETDLVVISDEQQGHSMSNCKILIVDDDEDDVGVLADAFTQCGVDSIHYVFTAIQAFMFLEELAHDRLPKLIVTDHFLPGMTGSEFLKDLKAMEKYKHIPAVVLATTKSEKELERYKEMGVLDYLIKPSSYEEYVKVAADIKSKAGL
jgi:CheY-like chemotaxis protein